MATPSQNLATSLELLRRLGSQGIIRSEDLSRTHRERLCRNGFLIQVLPGWYIITQAHSGRGQSTSWYTLYWTFCAQYLEHLKGDRWCLSPEHSLSIHAENWTVPPQLIVRAQKARNNVTPLYQNHSLLVIRAKLPQASVRKNEMRIFSLEEALVGANPVFFRNKATDARVALSLVREPSTLLKLLLEGGQSVVAGRLSGAFRNIGRESVADEIKGTMETAGYKVREIDPFDDQAQTFMTSQAAAPYAHRITWMWAHMRPSILRIFPSLKRLPRNSESYLQSLEAQYTNDAYHSLSIEGYEISPELIERVQKGIWRPDTYGKDRQQYNALVARGYWQSFKEVKKSIAKILKGGNPGEVVKQDHGRWYREMFAPMVASGFLSPSDLAGYRSAPVYISQSMHVPPSTTALRDAMPVFFEQLSQETEASVRIILGHFMFVYIHPYMDGNGRMGRFIMNAMMASGGHPWAVIPVERRQEYMAALEKASTQLDIESFCRFLKSLLRH